MKKICLAGMVLCLVTVATHAYEVNTPLVQKKIEAIESAKKSANDRSVYGTYKSPVVRTAGLRDSGHQESLMFIRNTNFRFIGDIGFFVPRLMLSLRPYDPGNPVIFDDPTSFYLKPHRGEVVLSPQALDALFNQHVFNFPGASLKELKATTAPGVLTLAGKMYRSKWVTFVMKGPLLLEQGHKLLFTPNYVAVDGVDATKVLLVANVKLDELLKVEAVGAKLIGNTIHLDTRLLFPPPKLDINLKGIRLEERGVVLTFDDGLQADVPEALQNAKSYMIVKGGDVKIMRTMVVNVLLQITSSEAGEPLDFCLYRYREQIAGGLIKLAPDGGIFAYLKNYKKLEQKGEQK